MTEEEAKEKWCPFVREGGGLFPHNRVTGMTPYDGNTACIGSACMAWRWSAAKDTEAFMALVRERVAGSKENFATATANALQEHKKTFEHTEGFCGLAGRE